MHARADLRLGSVAGIEIWIAPSALICMLGLWLVLGVLAFWLGLSLYESIVGGLLAALLYWLSEAFHQSGHAWAARRVGYPMIGVRLSGLLGRSLYPLNEPKLPAAIHIRRALGGPLMSSVVTVVTAVLVVLLWNAGALARWLSIYFLVLNLFGPALGSLLPLGFTDGSTLLRYWRKE